MRHEVGDVLRRFRAVVCLADDHLVHLAWQPHPMHVSVLQRDAAATADARRVGIVAYIYITGHRQHAAEQSLQPFLHHTITYARCLGVEPHHMSIGSRPHLHRVARTGAQHQALHLVVGILFAVLLAYQLYERVTRVLLHVRPPGTVGVAVARRVLGGFAADGRML